jgi:hypothetical protein
MPLDTTGRAAGPFGAGLEGKFDRFTPARSSRALSDALLGHGPFDVLVGGDQFPPLLGGDTIDALLWGGLSGPRPDRRAAVAAGPVIRGFVQAAGRE